MPYAPCDPDTTSVSPTPWSAANVTPYLSTRIYEKQGTTLVKVRSTYVIYDSDGSTAGDRQDRNHRLRYQKVLYHDDLDAANQPHTAETISSNFDGLGHYRGALSKSSFGLEKTAATGFLPAGSYQLNPDTGQVITDTFSLPAVSSPWIHGLSSGSTITQGSTVSKREACYDLSTGFLLRQRMLAGADRLAKTSWRRSRKATTPTAMPASWWPNGSTAAMARTSATAICAACPWAPRPT